MLNISETVLLVIDVQMAFAEFTAQGIPRSSPDAESNIERLLASSRDINLEVVHVHHHSKEEGSPFRSELPGALVQPFAEPLAGEKIYIKHANSAFIGTSLEADLRSQNVRNILVCGATANHCVETTTRMAGNLGFNVLYLSDCVWAYGLTGPDGRSHSPDDVLSVTLANLQSEFAQVVKASDALAMLN